MSIRVIVDMSVTLLHHGHIRLLRKAAKYGEVVVGLSTDEDISERKHHGNDLHIQRKRPEPMTSSNS